MTTSWQPTTLVQCISVNPWLVYPGCDEPGGCHDLTLGRIYEKGIGTKKDLVVAMKWFILAAEQAHPQATQKVEELSTTLPRDLQERATELVSEHYRRFRKRS